MLTDRLTANLSVSLFLWDKITHLKDAKIPFGTLVPGLLTRLFQRGCNTRITALERLYQQLWNKCNNRSGTTVTLGQSVAIIVAVVLIGLSQNEEDNAAIGRKIG